MGRYLEDVRRLKAMQNAERDCNAEKDLNVLVFDTVRSLDEIAALYGVNIIPKIIIPNVT